MRLAKSQQAREHTAGRYSESYSSKLWPLLSLVLVVCFCVFVPVLLAVLCLLGKKYLGFELNKKAILSIGSLGYTQGRRAPKLRL